MAQSASVNEFLVPQSMMTPGALGAIAMLGTNALTSRFPALDPSYVVLVFSFLFGLAAVVKDSSIYTRILFYTLNSIIIFSIAAGTNTVGQAARERVSLSVVNPAYAQTGRSSERPFFKPWFGESAPDRDTQIGIDPQTPELIVPPPPPDIESVSKLRCHYHDDTELDPDTPAGSRKVTKLVCEPE